MGSSLTSLLGGLFGYGPGTGANNAAGQLANQGVTGPATINTTQSNQDRANQQQLLALLTAQATGQGPSAAQSQLSQGIQSASANQAANASGGRYGANSNLRQQQVANQTAGLEAGGANSAAQLRANQMATGAQEANQAASGLRGQDVSQATAQAQLQNLYNEQLGGLYGAEQKQQAGAGQALQGSLFNAVGGGLGLGSGQGAQGATAQYFADGGLAGLLQLFAAHGALTAMKTMMGERGPEAMIPLDHSPAKLIHHPMVANLKKPAAIVPLKPGSAPYSKSGTGAPLPAPRNLQIDPAALAAMRGTGKTHSPGPGGAGLSPRTAPIVKRAMASHGMVAA